ncbi:hypothetical protein JX265_004506 [Neoarthrinium moseri]|uniref:Uncharacterized protein n=1 Tax=Neoarthrinium moseri TaxID=1658444 RepID=A0A9P9WR35_9PEZI|nr:uncharacterized protein JN550_008175 [Neoarthrinium moseri]KAI1840380.1 hypothetical protein JX266_013433 [Neoarthrinium moseri]KAI1865917.1 hypothetical protein JN550_008175 [Neoarthrinium moseri]KAI1875448.1 hypothetical protein JX265_004506 [Neoarthrinium moseri]
MYSKTFVSAAAALAMVSGVAAVSCDDPTATIASAADATTVASCDSIEGSVVVDSSSGSQIDFSGSLTKIGGDLIVLNNGGLISLSSTSLESIGGAFQVKNVTLLSTLKFTALSSVGTIDWSSLNALEQLTFGTPGVVSAKEVTIADTFLNTLDGINVHSLDKMDINNNHRLTDFTTELNNLTTLLNINANGPKLSVNMPNLIWAANMTISNVTKFSAQSLESINGSLRFDSNFFDTFSAPNLTEVQTGDLSFVSNANVTNITLPLLEKIGGGFTIANNTAMEDLNGFPKLSMVGGAVKLRGSFSSVELPALDDVRGAFDLSSTGDIKTSCEAFSSKAGSEIQGEYSCTSNNANANNDTDSTGGDSTTDESAAGALQGMSMSWLVSLVSIAGFVVAFL